MGAFTYDVCSNLEGVLQKLTVEAGPSHAGVSKKFDQKQQLINSQFTTV